MQVNAVENNCLKLDLWTVGDAIKCYVCNSGEDYNSDICDSISEASKDLIFDCDSLPSDLGRSKRNYTLCRKFVQDGKTEVLTFNLTLTHIL